MEIKDHKSEEKSRVKARRVELFASSELDYLESQINNWLSEFSEVEVLDIRFAANCVPSERLEIDEPMFDVVYTAIIMYEVFKEV